MGRSTEPAPRCRLARRPRGGREGLPFLLLLFRPAKLARIQQLRHLTPVAWQQWRPPLRVPPRLPQAQPRHCSGCNCASGRSSDSVLSALSFQPAQSGQLPRKGACSPSGSLSPCHHSSTPETLLRLLLFFITSGSGGLELLAGRPRLGAVQRGLPRPALSGSGGQSRNRLAPGLYSGPTGTWISKTSCTCLNQLEASRQTRLTSQRTTWPRAPSQALHSEWLLWQDKPVVGSKKPTKYQAF
ncbi:uncharacterized protein LOC121028004 [Herpailurus yagouaroundi]|uniref:uncharacterized protein LOC121028004 n=1 Tax=Herpailurus yagouaroundi TaxID=1608482 RepID=UPI001AD71D73|nr:uncharacterized protein LOC121028004 [Puma yagouaroundi]